MFSKLFENIKLFSLDICFPIRCLGCQTENSWLCEICLQKIQLRDQQVCPVCEKILTPVGQSCFSCKRKSPLAGILVACDYQNQLISQGVHFFKYRFIDRLAEPLAEVMLRAMHGCELPLPELIIPIPLHPRRLRWRGFNQSQLLTAYLAKNLLPNLELETTDKILLRQRYTQPQMKIKNQHHRQQNVYEAFVVHNPEKIRGKKILLVDDIATTGSTIFECARVLKEAGAKEVYAVVIARQGAKKKT